MKILDFYHKHYKLWLIIPIILLLASLASIGVKIAKTGDFINRDVSLKGGAVITIPFENEVNIFELNNHLSLKFPDDDLTVRSTKELGVQKSIIIEAGIEGEKSEIEAILKETESKLNAKVGKEYSVEVMGSSLGKSFFKELVIALIVSFILMAIVVAIYFRVAIPSLAVIISAFADIVMTIAGINLIGMKISTAGIAAFLMLIGYSVDTDVLLTTRVLKRTEGSVTSRVNGAIKTGMLMTTTTLAAVVVALIMSQSSVITQIMTILLVGLFFDMFNTWITNVAILRYYLEWKAKKNESKI